MRCLIFGIVATLFNVLFSYLAALIKVPFYLDTAGTIAMSALGGVFPGIAVAVATNIVCGIFNQYSLYYTFIGVMIAVVTAWYVRSHKLSKKIILPAYILIMAFIGGGIGTIYHYVLLGGPQFDDISAMAAALARTDSGPAFVFFAVIVGIGLNLVDKGFMAAVAFLTIRFLPDSIKEPIRIFRWKQTPLSESELNELKANPDDLLAKRDVKLRMRMGMMITIGSLSLAAAILYIMVALHNEKTKSDYTENAYKAARFAASVINGDRIDEYIKKGSSSDDYNETKKMLYGIRGASTGVKYLYVVRIEDDGCRFVFDLDSDDSPAYIPGEKVEFEEAFLPYLPKLMAGEEIEPIESNDLSGWVLTVYYPVRNSMGITTAYVGCDVSMSYLSDYVKTYLLRLLLVFSGFFVLILGYGLWFSDYSFIYPIGRMVSSVGSFVENNGEQDKLDENVRNMRRLNIRTADEIERLYDSICKMATDMAEQMRSVRHYAEATAQMQNGLIVTMADMVESRDSDTGAHVQKTSEYVRIILEGLKRKGYYAAKLTPKYMADVEMSAPLHDVGKINIPDAVLNKPGKLTDEEYTIMKTHTTAGKLIMERAINTVKGGSYLKEARNMAAYHHERWDGKGYPEGLHGEVIPLSARVMAIADVFDALASPRVYKPAFPLDKALSIIEEGAGTQFDPKCVEVFMENLDEVKEVLRKYQE